MVKNGNIALTVGLMVVFAGFQPAFAQFGEECPDGEQFTAVDEVMVTDPGLLALEVNDDGGGAPPLAIGQRGAPSQCPMGKMGGASFESCPPGLPGGPGKGPFAFLQGDLALSDAQYEKLFALRNGFLDKAGPVLAQMKANERDMLDLVTQSQLDKAKVKALQNKISDQKAQLANLRIDHRMDTLEVLTSDQRKELRRYIVKGGSAGCPRFLKRHKGGARISH